MCLRFVFLLVTRVTAWLRLSRREEAWKRAEILILRHQLAVLQRQPGRVKPDWADRALLAALVGVIPRSRRQGLRLLVTPDTMLRWHRDIVRRRWAVRSLRGRTGRPATRQNIKALVRRLARENIADLLDGTQAYVLTAIEHATRRIRILGVTLHPVGLDYWIWPGRAAGLGSSLSDLLGRLPARSPSARLSDGAGPG
jgi:hypothetical protein